MKKEAVVAIISGVMGLSSMLMSQDYDSSQKIQQAHMEQGLQTSNKDDLGTFGVCGMGMSCSGGGGQCGMGMNCGGQ